MDKYNKKRQNKCSPLDKKLHFDLLEEISVTWNEVAFWVITVTGGKFSPWQRNYDAT